MMMIYCHFQKVVWSNLIGQKTQENFRSLDMCVLCMYLNINVWWNINEYLAFGQLCRDVLPDLQRCRGDKMRVSDLPSKFSLTSSLYLSCTSFGSSFQGSGPHLLHCIRSRCRHVLRSRRLEALRNSHTSNDQPSSFSVSRA